ncbi:serine hydrolase [uncultured Psychroserpens sp.]|uniref:serine hydrolase domain-containing protein n=1 Tax=uncultured Psychroserpens sp. TaxID=255436 RepID=UPI00261CA8C9|nr:serine hydrolase [uncultured Psychroserpens sp.]
MIINRLMICCLVVFVFSLKVTAQYFPSNEWEIHSNDEEIGWSFSKLKIAESYNKTIKTSAVLIIYKGKILSSWGNIDKKYMCHSIRKSFLSALYGIYVDNGKIDISKSLRELKIDDIQPLSNTEKTATIQHLLKARSGIYHPAAYEIAGSDLYKPKRGKFKPGENWHYNNWDFNTLSTIFERETNKKIFEAFEKDIAIPIKMQDFDREQDTYYHYEKDRSQHPAYPFEMTASDMARFGLLILNKGNWNGQQIISKNWIKESTASYSESGYGYMWWIQDKPYKMIIAKGVGGHSIDIIPDKDLVIVIRTNTYKREGISQEQKKRLLELIINSKI